MLILQNKLMSSQRKFQDFDTKTDRVDLYSEMRIMIENVQKYHENIARGMVNVIIIQMADLVKREKQRNIIP